MPKQQRGQARRQQILDAADRLFRRQGYAATSMRQIAAESGFGGNASGLYNHFASKEAIFAALLESRSPYEELLGTLEEVQGRTLREFLRNWLAVVWPVMRQHLDFIQLVFIDLQEFEGRTLARFLHRIIPHFFVIFSRLQGFPEVRRDLPLPVLARTLASVMIGNVLTELLLQKNVLAGMPFPLATGDAWLDGVAGILARGLGAQEDTDHD